MKAIKATCFSCLALAFAAGTATSAAATTVDVLVEYDATAAAWFEDERTTPAQFAQAQIARANAVLSNSGLGAVFSFRLAGVKAAPFTFSKSTGLFNTLQLVAESKVSPWTTLRAIREDVGADLVAILADTGESRGEMGHAWGMAPSVQLGGIGDYERRWGLDFDYSKEWLVWFADRAYCIVDVSAARRGYTLVHELGHLMGAGHPDLDAFADPGPQLYQYSAGVMMEGSDGNFYSTIMGYDNYQSESYAILPYFSSPGIVNPRTGDALGDETHDNVRTLRNTCSVVAAFRDSKLDDGGSSSAGDDSTPAAKPPVFTAKKTVIDAVLTDSAGAVAGLAQFTVAATKKGVSKVGGYVIGLDGKKRRLKNTKCAVSGSDGVARVTLDGLAVKGFDGSLSATLGSDGSIADASLGDCEIARASLGIAADYAEFSLDETIGEILGAQALQSVEYNGAEYPLIPYAECPERVATGSRWKVVAKTGRLKLFKDRKAGVSYLVPVLGKDNANTNLSALKLTYQAKTGAFKGSFCVYALVDSRLKKFKFNITGLAADGAATGVAVCKKAALSIPVSIR